MKNSLVKYLDFESCDRVKTADSEKSWDDSQILTPHDIMTAVGEVPTNCR